MSMYFVKKLEKGGLLLTSERPQIREKGLGKGMMIVGGKRYQTASISKLAEKFNDPDAVEAYEAYTDSLKVGDEIKWVTPGTEKIREFEGRDGNMIQLNWCWGVINLNKCLDACEAFVGIDQP